MQCEIDYTDADTPSFYKSVIRKARKTHFCCECGVRINPKDLYCYEFIVSYGGDPGSFSMCYDCCSLRDQFFCSFYYGHIWRDFIMMVNDFNGEVSEEKINKLTPIAREKVIDIIDKVLARN